MSHKNKNCIVFQLKAVSVYDSNRKKFYTDFEWDGYYISRKDLVTRIAKESRYGDTILDNLSKNMNETSLKYFGWDKGYEKLYYIAKLNNLGEIVPVNIDSLRVDAERKRDEIEKNHPYPWWRTLKAVHYEFRKDPVPHTGWKHRSYKNYHHHSGLKSTVTAKTDPEYGEYSSKKYQNPYQMKCWDWDWEGSNSAWGDKCWKRNKKAKHQWQKNLPKHKNTGNYDKRALPEEEVL